MYNGQSCGTFWGIQWTTTLQHTTVLFRLYPSKRILSSHASAFNDMSIKHVLFFLWHAPIQGPVGILLVTPLGVFKYIPAFGHFYQEDGMVRKHTYHITYYRTRNPQWAMVMSYCCFTGRKNRIMPSRSPNMRQTGPNCCTWNPEFTELDLRNVLSNMDVATCKYPYRNLKIQGCSTWYLHKC